jgi:hypothetical protein
MGNIPNPAVLPNLTLTYSTTNLTIYTLLGKLIEHNLTSAPVYHTIPKLVKNYIFGGIGDFE